MQKLEFHFQHERHLSSMRWGGETGFFDHYDGLRLSTNYVVEFVD